MMKTAHWLFGAWLLMIAAGLAQEPAADQPLVLTAVAFRQKTPQSPLTLRMRSGDQIVVPAVDLHEPATAALRTLTRQQKTSIKPSLVFVVRVRQQSTYRAANRDYLRLLLSSGAEVAVRIDDVRYPQVTFLHTALSEYLSAEARAKIDAVAPNQPLDVSIVFDTKGVDFGPWLRRFRAQVRRNWSVPIVTAQGHVVITFTVHKDGRLTDVSVKDSSAVAALTEAVRTAVLNWNPTVPLPADYPSESAFFTVTFFYNQSPARAK